MNRRSFIKLSSINVASLFIPSISFSNEDSSKLEKLIHRDYRSSDEFARLNNQYLIANLNPANIENILNWDNLVSSLVKDLDKIEKLDYEKIRGIDFKDFHNANFGGSYDIFSLTKRQIARIYLILDALKKDKFRNEIGREIFEDLRDIQMEGGYLPTERGGLIKLVNGNPYIYPVDSTDSKVEYSEVEAADSNRRYKMPSKALINHNHIFDYHLHALTEDNEKLAGPSFNVKFPNGKIGGDLNLSRKRILEYGENHSIVITKLKDNKFDICYYGGEIEDKQKTKINILALGTWPYSLK